MRGRRARRRLLVLVQCSLAIGNAKQRKAKQSGLWVRRKQRQCGRWVEWSRLLIAGPLGGGQCLIVWSRLVLDRPNSTPRLTYHSCLPPFFFLFFQVRPLVGRFWNGGFLCDHAAHPQRDARSAQPENVALPVGGCTTPISAERSRLWAVRGETSQRVRGSETHAMGTSGERRPA